MSAKFFIQNGVRRALAAREAGLKTIRAIVYREGRKPSERRLRLSQLYASKRSVEYDYRLAAISPPIREAIEVEPLGARGQQSSVPLTQVRIA